MSDNKFQPDTPADTLHAHVQAHLDLPDHEKMADDNEAIMNEATAHPNLSSKSIKALYDNAMAHNQGTPSGEMGTAEHQNLSSEAMENLLKHPNTPHEIKHDFALKTFHPENAQSGLHEDMADTHLSEDELRGIADKLLAQGEIPHSYKNLPPSYYMNHFKKATQTENGEDDDTLGVSKSGAFAYHGLMNSAKHTPESLDQTIEAIHANKHFKNGGHQVDNPGMLEDLVEKRPDLSKDQLNKIHQMVEGHKKKYYHSSDPIDKILEHPNVDPSLVAKYAVGKDVRPNALKNPNLPKETIDAFVRRSKDPNDYNERTAIQELLQNPAITKEQVSQLVKRGSRKAINHPLASEEDVRNHWNTTDKGLEASRNILQAKNLPPDVLKDLVNHKNQDVAIDAINHPKADMDVVNEGLARKAKKVQDAARVHPLVAEQQVGQALKSGKTSLSNIYSDEDFKAHFDKMPKADQDAIFNKAHEKYSAQDKETLQGTAKRNKERTANVIHSKYHLATDPRVPEPIREKHSQDLADLFNETVVKNKIPKMERGSILSDDHPDDSSRILKAVTQMASKGNPHAEKAILNNPAVMQGLKSYVGGKEGFDSLRPDFLESLYRKSKEYQLTNDQIYDNYGQPVKFDDRAQLLEPIFQSKNLPSAVFDEIAQNPADQEKLGEHDEFNRYNELPPEQQDEKYRAILNSGSQEAAKSVIRANAPPQSWDRALSMLPKDEQNKIVGSQIEHIKEHRPDVYNYAALGLYNKQGDQEGQRSRFSNDRDSQIQAISKMKRTSASDVGLAKQVMAIPEGSVGHLTDDEFMGHVPGGMMSEPSLIDHAIQSNRPLLANKILGRSLNDQSDSLSTNDYLKTPEEKAHNQAKAEALLATATQRVQSMPSGVDSTDNEVASNWENLIQSAKSKHGDYGLFHNLKKAGISLDFLADMPGEAGRSLREAALKNNYLSKEKLGQVASEGDLDDVLSIGDGMKRQEAFAMAIKNPNLDLDSIQKITYAMKADLLNPEAYQHGRRKSMSDDAHAIYQSRLNSLIDLYSAKAPDQMSSMLSNAMNSGKSKDTFTKEDMSRISKGVMEHISNKPYATPTDKNMAMYQAYKALSNKDAAPARLLNQVEKGVFESKDYETMVKMAEDAKLSDDGMNKLAKIVRQPGTLNSGQIAGLSTRFDGNTEPETVVNMAKTFEMKLAQEQAEAPNKDQTAQKMKMMTSLGKTYSPGASNTEEGKAKNDFVLNYTKKLSLDPKLAPHANTQLVSLAVRTSSTDVDKAVSVLSSLPDDASQFSTTNLAQAVPEALANDSRFVEMAKSGWKLGMLAENASQLTGNNASILTQRALTDESGYTKKLAVYSDLDDNQYTAPDDSVKLGRALSHNDFNTWVRNNQDNSLTGNGMFTAAARLKDLEAAAKDPNLVAAGAPFMGAEHRNHVIYNAEALTAAIKYAKMGDGIANLNDKLSRVSEIISGVHQHVKTVAAALRAEVEKTGYNTDVGRDQQYLLSIAKNIASTGLQLDRDDSLKVMDMIKEYHSIPREDGKVQPPEASYDVVSNLVQRAENFEDQDWKQMFSSAPHAVFQLNKRSSIPAEALNSVDYKMIEDHPTQDKGENVQDTFTKNSAQWFNKMSQADLQTHGKNLMSMYVRMQNNGTISPRSYDTAMQAALGQMSRHMSDKDVQNLLTGTKDQSLRQSLYKQAVKNGAGGVDTLRAFARDYDKIMGHELFRDVTDFPRGSESQLRQVLEPITSSPHLDDELSGKVCDMFDQNPDQMQAAMENMLDNKNAPQSAVSRIAKDVVKNHHGEYKKFDQRQSNDMAMKLMSHPNIPESDLMDMFKLTNESFPKYFGSSDDPDSQRGKFNPALQNPTHGGKLLRSMPVHIPKDVPGVDVNTVTRSVGLQAKDYAKTKEIMSLIPPEGISWVEFKRKYPQVEKNIPAAAKQAFTSANNKPVMPEDFVKVLEKLDDNAKKYHLTYSRWTSDLQRHRGSDQKPNLVVQINNSEESEKELSRDPKLWSLYQNLLQQANGVSGGSIGLHPTTPHLVSWSRVDTDQGGDAWVIEEAQSDFAQKFRGNLKSLMKNFPAGANINGQKITADEMAKYAKVIDKHLEDWSEASMQAVIENAKAHGITKIYMHGAEMRAKMSGGIRNTDRSGYTEYSREFFDNPNTKPRTVGFRKIYDENPRKLGFQECDYTDYPKHSQKMLKSLNDKKLSTKCWLLDLVPGKPAKKRGSKPNLE